MDGPGIPASELASLPWQQPNATRVRSKVVCAATPRAAPRRLAAVVRSEATLAFAADEHLRLLQEKVYRYLDFIGSGEFYRKRPNARGRRLVIRIRTTHQFPRAAITLIEQLRTVTLNEGVDLELRERAP